MVTFWKLKIKITSIFPKQNHNYKNELSQKSRKFHLHHQRNQLKRSSPKYIHSHFSFIQLREVKVVVGKKLNPNLFQKVNQNQGVNRLR